jgi:hypothetical protein
LLLLTLAFAITLRADPSLPPVQQARALLGPDVWSRVIRIENTAGSSPYPRVLHALVFELADILWFYTPQEGTQSFSLHRGRLAEEKSDFGPLLRDIEPGFVRWREVEQAWSPLAPYPPLPNGCFIESVIALRERLMAGERVRHPRLLSYYFDPAEHRAGHTVLVYEVGESVVVYDAAQPRRRVRLPVTAGGDPVRLARAIDRGRILRARTIPLEAAMETLIASRAVGGAATG